MKDLIIQTVSFIFIFLFLYILSYFIIFNFVE
jgi:hypothetical protein